MKESCIVYLTGYPGSGKLTIAKQIKSMHPSFFEIIDSHTISNIVFDRSNRKIAPEENNFFDCEQLLHALGGGGDNTKLEIIKSLAQQAYDLPAVKIFEGDSPTEKHYQLVERIRDIVFEYIEAYPKKSFIFTNKLYENNSYHAQLIIDVKNLCNDTRVFLGFKIEVNLQDLLDRIKNSDRRKNGKLINPNTLIHEFESKKLTNDPDFVSIADKKTSYLCALTILRHISNKIGNLPKTSRDFIY